MNEQQSIADHRHGLRFVDDDGRCLACALVVAEERIRELEAIVKDDKRCMESLRSLLECCPEDDRSNVDWHSEWHDMRLAHAREYRDRLFYQGTTYLLFAVVVVVLIASGVKA